MIYYTNLVFNNSVFLGLPHWRRGKMSTKFGRIPEYDPFSVDWKEYSEQLEQFFLANDVDTSEKKRAILLSSCGSAAYSLFRNLVAPAAPKDKTFEQLIEVMETHQNPTPSIIVERFKFYKRDRELTEPYPPTYRS